MDEEYGNTGLPSLVNIGYVIISHTMAVTLCMLDIVPIVMFALSD